MGAAHNCIIWSHLYLSYSAIFRRYARPPLLQDGDFKCLQLCSYVMQTFKYKNYVGSVYMMEVIFGEVL